MGGRFTFFASVMAAVPYTPIGTTQRLAVIQLYRWLTTLPTRVRRNDMTGTTDENARNKTARALTKRLTLHGEMIEIGMTHDQCMKM
ncbi:hypothetical protein SAMN02787142_1043 [Burkholderia sp. WP9]|jgi:hypothetical protein|nr:hypothetical protein SAMN02787142_1043 [Burkholderia sp. WP9]